MGLTIYKDINRGSRSCGTPVYSYCRNNGSDFISPVRVYIGLTQSNQN